MAQSESFPRELTVARTAVRAAGIFIKQHLGNAGKVRRKGEYNIVTEVDVRAEALIVRMLRRAFPHDGIVAEERPAEPRGTRTWFVDPLDGTTNFAHRFPFFAVSIGLYDEHGAAVGAVYDPLHGELFSAVRGKGAYCNTKRITVSRQRDMRRAFLSTGFSYSFKEKPRYPFRRFRNLMLASMAVRRAGAAALDICYVACGRFDGFWEQDLKPWDTAAASLVVCEAGGKVTRFDGRPYSCGDTTIVASNGALHPAMVRLLKK